MKEQARHTTVAAVAAVHNCFPSDGNDHSSSKSRRRRIVVTSSPTTRKRPLFERIYGVKCQKIRQFFVLIFSIIFLQQQQQLPPLLLLVEASSSSSIPSNNQQRTRSAGIAASTKTVANTIITTSTNAATATTTTTATSLLAAALTTTIDNAAVGTAPTAGSTHLLDSCLSSYFSSNNPLSADSGISSHGKEEGKGDKRNASATSDDTLTVKSINSTKSLERDDDGVTIQKEQITKKGTNAATTGSSDIDATTTTTTCGGAFIVKKKKKKKKHSSTTINEMDKKKKKVSHEVSTTLRRLQNEWKDIVSAGMAYDWIKGEPRRQKRRESKNNNTTTSTSTSATATLQQQQQQHLYVGPLGKSLLVWHFTFAGLDETPYEHGIYHGRIILPKTYPAKPPRVQVWTPSGRYQCGVDICLSASQYHPETWSASSWTIRTLLESLRLHMTTTAQEIGGLQSSYERRVQLARDSRHWKCALPMAAVSSLSSSSGDNHNNNHVFVDHARMIAQGLFRNNINDDDVETITTTTMKIDEQELSHVAWTAMANDSRELEEELETLSLKIVQNEDQKVALIAAALIETTIKKESSTTTKRRRRKRDKSLGGTKTVSKRRKNTSTTETAISFLPSNDLTTVLRRQHPRLASSVVSAATKKQKRASAAISTSASSTIVGIVTSHVQRLVQVHGALRVIAVVGFLILFCFLNIR